MEQHRHDSRMNAHYARRFLMASLLFAGLAIIPALLCTSTTSPGAGGPLHAGDTATLQGVKILFLRGTHYERGTQHGRLMGEAIMTMFHAWQITGLFAADDSMYTYARAFIDSHFVFAPEYRTEAGGMIAGIRRANLSLHDPVLGRDIDSMDILVVNCIEELLNITNINFGCSSISSWGESTVRDTVLKGETVITRHWDYPRFPDMIRNLVLIVHQPAEIDEHPWISGAWAGSIGSRTAMSDSVGAFLNYAPIFGPQTYMNKTTHRPVSFSIRAAIERNDYNGDGRQSNNDIIDAIKAYAPCFGTIIHAVQPAHNDTPAVVIESDNSLGIMVRTGLTDADSLPGSNLAATNHFRVLSAPIFCGRYQKIIDSLTALSLVGLDRSWDLLAGAGAYPGCIYSISYVPKSGIIRWAVTSMDDPAPAYERQSARFTMRSLVEFGR